MCQKIDLTAIAAYNKLVLNLKQNQPITSAEWTGFLAHKGIQLYLKNQAFDTVRINNYKRALEIVFMPKHENVLEERLNTPDKYYLTKTVYQYKLLEEKMNAFVKQIENNPTTYIDSAYGKVYRFLPHRMKTKATQTILYIIPMYDDAIAEENDIVFSLYGLYMSDQVAFGTLAGHELHHILRKNKTNTHQKDSILFEAISKILNEGVPDLIDKKASDKPEYPNSMNYYAFMMENGKNYLVKMDSIIQNFDTISKTLGNKIIWDIAPMSGHIPGCYMAYVIERNGLLKNAIKHVDDPIVFFESYNKAAKKDKDNPPILSKKTIKRIKAIQTNRVKS